MLPPSVYNDYEVFDVSFHCTSCSLFTHCYCVFQAYLQGQVEIAKQEAAEKVLLR
jgi:hypothetical protein